MYFCICEKRFKRITCSVSQLCCPHWFLSVMGCDRHHIDLSFYKRPTDHRRGTLIARLPLQCTRVPCFTYIYVLPVGSSYRFHWLNLDGQDEARNWNFQFIEAIRVNPACSVFWRTVPLNFRFWLTNLILITFCEIVYVRQYNIVFVRGTDNSQSSMLSTALSL